MRKFNINLLILLTLIILISPANADHIIIAADNWCPVNCDPESEEPGYMVEIAKRVFSEAGYSVEYLTRPWARAIIEGRNGTITGIIGAFKGDAPDFVFPENELGRVYNSFFVAKDSKWSYKDMSSLDNVKLGAILAYDYGSEISDYLEKHKNTKMVDLISGNNALERNIKKLFSKRVDVIIETSIVFWYTTNKMGLKDQVRFAGKISEPEKVYIAFSPALSKSKEYARILSDGIEALRNSGELDLILSKYGLADWETDEM